MKRSTFVLMLSLGFLYACNSEKSAEQEPAEENKIEETMQQMPEIIEKKATSAVSDFTDWTTERIDETINQTKTTLSETQATLQKIEAEIAAASGAAKTEAEAKLKIYKNRVQILEEKLTNLDLAKKEKETTK